MQEYQIDQNSDGDYGQRHKSPTSASINVNQIFNNEKILSKNSSNIMIHPQQSAQQSVFGIDELIHESPETQQSMLLQNQNQDKKVVGKKNTT